MLVDEAPYDVTDVEVTQIFGPDGLPVQCRFTKQIIANTELTGYVCSIDVPDASLQVRSGGTAGAACKTSQGHDGVRVDFGEPLAAGGSKVIDYVFHYSFSPDTPPPNEFRCSTGDELWDNVDVTVEFDAARVPAHVVHVSWERPDSEECTGDGETVELGGGEEEGDCKYVYCLLSDLIPGTTVGFVWEW